jgi:lysozyme inhibitor LprI
MRRAALFVLASFLVSAVKAQPAAVDACRDFAKRELARSGTTARDVAIDRDAALLVERRARNVGSQRVQLVVSGNGAVVFDAAPSAELSFVCLLADERRALLFAWLPRGDATAMAQCLRSAALRAGPRPCLEALEQVAEQDLLQADARRFHEAGERGGEALAAYRKSSEAWHAYRDAECLRRRGAPPEGISADDYQLACVIELTRRRVLDTR